MRLGYGAERLQIDSRSLSMTYLYLNAPVRHWGYFRKRKIETRAHVLTDNVRWLQGVYCNRVYMTVSVECGGILPTLNTATHVYAEAACIHRLRKQTRELMHRFPVPRACSLLHTFS